MTWISFTGIDGVGKTTLVNHVSNLLQKKHTMKTFKSPHFDWVREMIAISGQGKPCGDVHTDALIFGAGMRCEMYLVEEWAKSHDILVSQRSWLDFFPYNKTKNIDYDESIRLLRPESLRRPDILFFIDCDSTTALQRLKQHTTKDKYEEPKFMHALRTNFLDFIDQVEKHTFPLKFQSLDIIRLDGRKDLQTLKEETEEILKKKKFI